MFKLNKNDVQMLAELAEYRVLTVGQLADLRQQSARVLQRRLKPLNAAGVIEISTLGFGHGRGRPAGVVALTAGGIECLRDEKILTSEMTKDRAGAIEPRLLNHQLLVNAFRVRLVQIRRLVPLMTTRFLSPTSPFAPTGSDGKPFVWDHVQLGEKDEKPIGFTPDGVLSITDPSRQKTLLFFLEADMGTEPITSASRPASCIHQKVLIYQAYFRSGGYKRYEKHWNCPLNGFRLLFLTPDPPRLAALCQLARGMPPSDFVWLTDQQRLLQDGLTAPIWARGGRLDAVPESILGRAIPTSPAGSPANA